MFFKNYFITILAFLALNCNKIGKQPEQNGSDVKSLNGREFSTLTAAIPFIHNGNFEDTDNTDYDSCSGVIVKHEKNGIPRKFLITALHCIFDTSQITADDPKRVLKGGLKLSIPKPVVQSGKEIHQFFQDPIELNNPDDQLCFYSDFFTLYRQENKRSISAALDIVVIKESEDLKFAHLVFDSDTFRIIEASQYLSVPSSTLQRYQPSKIANFYKIVEGFALGWGDKAVDKPLTLEERRFLYSYTYVSDRVKNYDVDPPLNSDQKIAANKMGSFLLTGRGDFLPGDSGAPFIIKLNSDGEAETPYSQQYSFSRSDSVSLDYRGFIDPSSSGAAGLAITYKNENGYSRGNYIINLSSVTVNRLLNAAYDSLESGGSDSCILRNGERDFDEVFTSNIYNPIKQEWVIKNLDKEDSLVGIDTEISRSDEISGGEVTLSEIDEKSEFHKPNLVGLLCLGSNCDDPSNVEATTCSASAVSLPDDTTNSRWLMFPYHCLTPSQAKQQIIDICKNKSAMFYKEGTRNYDYICDLEPIEFRIFDKNDIVLVKLKKNNVDSFQLMDRDELLNRGSDDLLEINISLRDHAGYKSDTSAPRYEGNGLCYELLQDDKVNFKQACLNDAHIIGSLEEEKTSLIDLDPQEGEVTFLPHVYNTETGYSGAIIHDENNHAFCMHTETKSGRLENICVTFNGSLLRNESFSEKWGNCNGLPGMVPANDIGLTDPEYTNYNVDCDNSDDSTSGYGKLIRKTDR